MGDSTGGLEFGRGVLRESELKSRIRDSYELHRFSAGSALFVTMCAIVLKLTLRSRSE